MLLSHRLNLTVLSSLMLHYRVLQLQTLPLSVSEIIDENNYWLFIKHGVTINKISKQLVFQRVLIGRLDILP